MTSTQPNLLESLSRLYDGDLPADESRFLMRRLQSDQSLAATWSRWSVASAALRRQEQRLLPSAFVGEVMTRIEGEAANEPAPEAQPWSRRPWLRWTGGLAVAASAALIALFANVPEPAEPGAQVAASNLRETDLRPRLNPASTVAAEAVGPVLGFAPEQEGLSPELQDYMIRHNAMLQEAGISGFVPYLDVIAHQSAADAKEGRRQ